MASTIWSAAPADGARYRIGLHWSGTDYQSDSLPVATTILCGGQRMDVERTLEAPHEAVELGAVAFADGTCTFTEGSATAVVGP